MPRAALATLAGGALLALIAVLGAAAADERRFSFALEVQPRLVVAVAGPGEEACQRGIEVEAAFDVVEVLLGTYARPGPALAISVRGSGSRRLLARGLIPAGAGDNQPARGRLDREVPDAGRVDVCVRNAGRRRVAFYGGSIFDSASTATIGGEPAGDIVMSFHRAEPRSVLSTVPEMPGRAAILRPDPIGAWTFWLMVAALVLGGPMLLGAALLRAAR